MHADAAAEAARRAAEPARQTFAVGFQTGHEMNWLPRAMHVLRDELKNIEVTITSDYSPDLAEALARGRLDLAFLRVEPNDLLTSISTVGGRRAAHRLDAQRSSSHCCQGSPPARSARRGAHRRCEQGHRATRRHRGLSTPLEASTSSQTKVVNNIAMAISLVASTRGLALMPAYANNLLPQSVVSRPLEGEAPTIAVAVGYSKSNASPILKLFLARLSELTGRP